MLIPLKAREQNAGPALQAPTLVPICPSPHENRHYLCLLQALLSRVKTLLMPSQLLSATFWERLRLLRLTTSAHVRDWDSSVSGGLLQMHSCHLWTLLPCCAGEAQGLLTWPSFLALQSDLPSQRHVLNQSPFQVRVLPLHAASA